MDLLTCFITSLAFPVMKANTHESSENHDVTLKGGSAGITTVETCSVLARFIYPCFETIWNCGLKDMHTLGLDRLCRKKMTFGMKLNCESKIQG